MGESVTIRHKSLQIIPEILRYMQLFILLQRQMDKISTIK